MLLPAHLTGWIRFLREAKLFGRIDRTKKGYSNAFTICRRVYGHFDFDSSGRRRRCECSVETLESGGRRQDGHYERLVLRSPRRHLYGGSVREQRRAYQSRRDGDRKSVVKG